MLNHTNKCLSHIATQQQILQQKIDEFGTNNINQPLRIEKNEIKLGPKSYWYRQFLTVVRLICTPVKPLIRIITNQIDNIDRLNNVQYKDAAMHVLSITSFGKEKIQNRNIITLSEVKQFLKETSRQSIGNRIHSPYLDINLDLITEQNPITDQHLIIPNQYKILCNIERNYRLQPDEHKVNNKLKKETENALQQCKAFSVQKKQHQNRLMFTFSVHHNYASCPDNGTTTIKMSTKAHKELTVPIFYTTVNQTGIAETKGTRSNMEDKYVSKLININLGVDNDYKIQLNVVFDGHGATGGGQFISDYMSKKIPEYLIQRLQEFNKKKFTDLGIWNALKISFVDASNSYDKNQDFFENDPGTAANLMMKMPNGDIWLANCGDSRAILINPNNNTQQITTDHKAYLDKDLETVESRGGAIFEVYSKHKKYEYRVNARLNLTRSLGNHKYLGVISPRPKITKFEKPKDGWQGYYILQACDGVWDVFNSKEAGNLIYQNIKKGDTVATASAKIASDALEYGSTDNISVMLTKLN